MSTAPLAAALPGTTPRDRRTGSIADETLTERTAWIEELFESHQVALFRFAVRMTSDRELAWDLVQETFVRALDRGAPTDDRARSWLMRTLVNLCRDEYRRRKVRRTHRVRARTDEAQRDASAPVEARLMLERAMRRLPPRRRAVVVLRELEGLTTRQVARLLGVSRATVCWHLAAGRRDLEKALREGVPS